MLLARRLALLTAAVALLLGESTELDDALGTDDECAESLEDGGCALSAVQMKGRPHKALHQHLQPTPSLVSEAMAEIEAVENRTAVNGSRALFAQLEYELEVGAGDKPRSKVALALLELVGFGMCGIDRCYMGQACLGTLKGITIGGFLVWAFLDYLAVTVTCLSGSEYINALGMRGSFTASETVIAFWVTLIVLVVKCGGCLCNATACLAALRAASLGSGQKEEEK
eukprot:TRINITY_DN76975_c0_g1_i1.p1 TRINITY_DN76975_c0_g1~~TRINITY_DN76975_c0_g1_i1.p1  ORF type:complete len:252 (-),score=57.48 TRINITY_DN76975_c0_g1_i1:31-711(-)